MLGNNQRKTKTYVSVSQLSGCVLYFHCVVLMFVFTFASFLRRYNPGRSCLYTSGGVVVEEVLRNRAFPALHDILYHLTGDSDSLGAIVRPSAIDLAPPPSATRPLGFNEKLKPGLLQPGSMSCDQPSDSLIGQKVFKDFGHGLSGEYYGAFNGRVVSYDATKLYYSIEWSDGDTEEMNR